MVPWRAVSYGRGHASYYVVNVKDTGVTGLSDGRLSPVLCTAWVQGKATPRTRGSLRGWAGVAVTAWEEVTTGGVGSTSLGATYVA